MKNFEQIIAGLIAGICLLAFVQACFATFPIISLCALGLFAICGVLAYEELNKK